VEVRVGGSRLDLLLLRGRAVLLSRTRLRASQQWSGVVVLLTSGPRHHIPASARRIVERLWVALKMLLVM